MLRNILNVGEVENFLRELAQDIDDPRLAEYLVIALKKTVLSNDDFFEAVSSYPVTPPAWLTQDKFSTNTLLEFKPELTNGSADTFRHVKDWIAGALNDGDSWIDNIDEKGRPKKLVQISSLADAYSRAEKNTYQKSNILRSVLSD